MINLLLGDSYIIILSNFLVNWDLGAWSQWTNCYENTQRRERSIIKEGNLKRISTQEIRDCDLGKRF